MNRENGKTRQAGRSGRATEGHERFQQFDDRDVRALIEEYPLAWVCGGSAGAIEASLLPLIGIFDADGRLIELIGHLMRSNPLYPALTREAGGTILFSGPERYISPEYVYPEGQGARDWAPTWNYAQVRIRADIAFDEALTEYSLQLLVDAMEQGRGRPWAIDELGARYPAMLEKVIGFRARVAAISGKFKLGQDERPEAFAAILQALPGDDLVAWMRRFKTGQ